MSLTFGNYREDDDFYGYYWVGWETASKDDRYSSGPRPLHRGASLSVAIFEAKLFCLKVSTITGVDIPSDIVLWGMTR
jgi:hypothetical protein